MKLFLNEILSIANNLNPGVVTNPIEFTHKFNSITDVESVADYYCHHFPHWMLDEITKSSIKFSHPKNTDFYIDPFLLNRIDGMQLYSLCSSIIKKEKYSISFEDSYFLDCFLENHSPEKPVIIIHIDHHTDRGWFFGELEKGKEILKLSSTGENIQLAFDTRCISTLRKHGILHQGNFLSFFSFFPNGVQVVYATNEITEEPHKYSIKTSIEKDEYSNYTTRFSIATLEPKTRYIWREGPRSSIKEMIESAISESPDAEIFVHIDLDEYDNPWDGNSYNEGNMPKDTLSVIREFSSDLSIIDSFEPKFTHFCMPTGFFPAIHWIKTISAIGGFYD